MNLNLRLSTLLIKAFCFAGCILGILVANANRSFAESVSQKTAVSRYVAIGMVDVPRSWKLRHPSDSSFVFILDTATGLIEICSDMKGICRSIAGSEREPKGSILGRFSGLKTIRVTDAWKAKHPSDRHLIYSFDSAIAQIQICSDVTAVCVLVPSQRNRATVQRPKIVMLYRRADSAAIAGRIYDRFVAHYGKDSVFMDIYDIPLATDWRSHVNSVSLNGDVLVVLIGPRWIGKGPDGHIRINDLDDPVRTELETALDANVPVVPVLVEGASMPKAADLPDGLKRFANVNAAVVDSGRDFDHHMAKVIHSISQLFETRRSSNQNNSKSK